MVNERKALGGRHIIGSAHSWEPLNLQLFFQDEVFAARVTHKGW